MFLFFPGGPFILKLTPNKPSPTSFGIIMSPITGIFDKIYLNSLLEQAFL